MTATTNYDMSGRTLCIRYRERSDHDIEQALAAIDRGETPEPHLEIAYHGSEDLHRVTRPELLELLRAIVQHDSDSIRETALLVEEQGGATADEVADIMGKDQEKIEHDIQKLKDRGTIYEMNGELKKA